jgi:hypothetical protein
MRRSDASCDRRQNNQTSRGDLRARHFESAKPHDFLQLLTATLIIGHGTTAFGSSVTVPQVTQVRDSAPSLLI